MLLLTGWSIKSQDCIASPGYVFDFNLAETCRQEIPFNAGIDFSGTPKPVVAGQDFQDFRIFHDYHRYSGYFLEKYYRHICQQAEIGSNRHGRQAGLPLNIIQRINH